jgi:hypothetical protein
MADLPDLAIDFHGAQRGAHSAKPRCRALSP